MFVQQFPPKDLKDIPQKWTSTVTLSLEKRKMLLKWQLTQVTRTLVSVLHLTKSQGAVESYSVGLTEQALLLTGILPGSDCVLATPEKRAHR